MKIFNYAPGKGAPLFITSLFCLVTAPVALIFLPMRFGVLVTLFAVVIVFVNELDWALRLDEPETGTKDDRDSEF